MCLRLPGDEFIPIFRGQVDLCRDLIPIVLLLLDGLYRIWLAPSGATEGCPVGLNRS